MANARILSLSPSYPLFHSQKPILSNSFPIFSFSFPSKRGVCSNFRILSTPRNPSSGDFDIVFTKENPDGSVVFKFGDPSEIMKNVEAEEKLAIRPGEVEITDEEEELVHSVRLVDESTEGGTISVDDSEDAKSSAGNDAGETISIKVVSLVDKSEIVDVVEEGHAGGSCQYTTEASSSDVVSSETVVQEKSENDVASESTEFEIEVPASFASEACKKENFKVKESELSTQKTPPNYTSKGESEILSEQQANVEVDGESSKTTTQYDLNQELTEDTFHKNLSHDALDAEHVEEQTLHIVDVEQQAHHLLEEESSPQPVDKEVAEQPDPSALDEESVHSEGDESMNMYHTTQVTNSIVDEQSADNVVVEEPVAQKTQDVVLDKELPVSDETVERLELLDVKVTSNRIEETVNNSDGDVAVALAEGSQLRDAALTIEGTSTPFFLVSGAASLPYPSKALTGGEDAYFVHKNWLGVADGVGQWSLEGTSAGVYAQELMKNCEKSLADSKNTPLTEPVEVLKKASVETLAPGSSTALVANFDGQALHVANIGDSGFLIIRNGAIFEKSYPMLHEFNFPVHIKKDDDLSKLVEEYNINLDEGDIIIIGTDGLFDNLYDREIASIVCNSLAAGMKLEEIAEIVAEKAQQVGQSKSVRSPFADEAQAAGYVGYNGGKLDDVTVIVSLVQQTSSDIS